MGTVKDLIGGCVLNKVAQIEEVCFVADADGLLHLVGHDEHRVVLLELNHQVLNALGADGIQGGGQLIEQQNLGLNAEALPSMLGYIWLTFYYIWVCYTPIWKVIFGCGMASVYLIRESIRIPPTILAACMWR
ncbi:MAG TPA: hypothetical protein DCP28_28760, partial [Cytophagales bacterium]|nr:hypothetical protein [Cytophagales bacterium]